MPYQWELIIKLYFYISIFAILVMLCGIHFVSQVVWELYLAVRLSSWLLQSSYITELYWLRFLLESCLPETCQTYMMLLYYMKILECCCVYIPGRFFLSCPLLMRSLLIWCSSKNWAMQLGLKWLFAIKHSYEQS